MRRSRALVASVASTVLIVAAAQANSQIRTIKLGQDEIATVKTAEGITTRFVFPDQVKEIICGDLYDAESGRGGFVVQRIQNDVFLKPLIRKGMTNMFVKTGENGEHTYGFDLIIAPHSEADRVVNIVDPQLEAARRRGLGERARRATPPPLVRAQVELPPSGGAAPPVAIDDSLISREAPPPPPSKEDRRTVLPASTRREVIRRVAAEYPEMARKVGAIGEVVVEVTIDRRGKVTSAKAISGHLLLRGAAIVAAGFWRFTPATEDREQRAAGEGPGLEMARITFNFRGPEHVDSFVYTGSAFGPSGDRRDRP